MRFPAPLFPATLVRRYKRFLADVVLPSGETVTVHCANPGSMIGLNAAGARGWLSESGNTKGKDAHNWELIEVGFGSSAELVGINTVNPNTLPPEAIARGAGAGPRGRGHRGACRLCRGPPRGEIREKLTRRFSARSTDAAAVLRRDQERAPDAPAGIGRIPRCGDQARGEAPRRAWRHGGGGRPRGDA